MDKAQEVPDEAMERETEGEFQADSSRASRAIDPATAARLARIRYLYGIADRQADLPEDVRSIAILAMHDAVELFLHLAAQHVNVPLARTRRFEFGDYFDEIAKAGGSLALSRQHQMRQLNTARVGLKHDGIRPSSDLVDELRLHVDRFFAENTPLVFGVSFNEVSVVDFIRFPTAREHLRNAELALARDDTGTATIALVQGFHAAIDEFEKEAIAAHGRSPFSFADDFTFDSSFHRRGVGRRDPFAPDDQGEFEDRIIRSIGSLGNAVKMLSLGLDYRRYARFRLLTPPVNMLPIPGKGGPQLSLGEEDGWPLSDADCRFCLEFAIDSALLLQDVVFNKPSWRIGMYA